MPQLEHSAGTERGAAAARPAGDRGRTLDLADRRLLLRVGDVAGVAVAWWLFLRPGVAPAGAGPAVVSLVALCLLWLLTAEGAGAYPPESHRAGRDVPPVVPAGPALVASGLLLAALAAPALWGAAVLLPGWGRLLGFVAALVVLPAAARLALRPLLAAPALRPRVLVVGTSAAAEALADVVREEGRAVYWLVGAVDAGEPVDRIVEEHGVDLVALADRRAADASPGDPLSRCVERGVPVVPLAQLVERLTGRVPLRHLEGAADDLPLAPPATRPLHRAAKRALDLVLVAVGLVFFVPVLPLIALAIRLESPGPVFYTQERVGRGGEVFRMYKLRSMVADAEAEGRPRWATENDPRITRVGRVLRGMHLDEFPQMLNILRGEMSPVGPRPERPEFVARLEGRIPRYRMRHAVRPGMAGWALVEHGYASSLEEARDKHEYDLYYVKHQSVWLDLVVLARTLVDTFTLGGR